MCLTLLHDHACEGGDGQLRHNVADLADPVRKLARPGGHELATVEVARYLENWQHEVDSAAENRAIASGEPDPKWESMTSARELAQREAILR
jgi:hypothetical protein